MKIVLDRKEFLKKGTELQQTRNVLTRADFANEKELKIMPLHELSDNKRMKKIDEFLNQ